MATSTWKENFYIKLLEMKEKSKEDHFTIINRDEYNNLLKEIEIAKVAPKKTALQYRRLKRFDIMEVAGIKKLIKKTDTDDIRYILSIDEIFDVIDAAHVAIGHGGRDRLKMETAKNYANITIHMINLFLSMCEACQLKKNKSKKGLVSKPILHTELNSRCQVDLLDMQTQADGNYKFIMVYQDHFTKFVMLKPLITKRADEVACNVVDIFTIFGAPCILHSNNGREFANKIISELKLLWPELVLVHGKPRHSQSQDIENMLATWMKDNNTKKWSEGLRFIQFMKNRTLHSGIRQTPYKAMFGIEPRVGLATTMLPLCVLNKIESEEELVKLTNAAECNDEPELEFEQKENYSSESENEIPIEENACLAKQTVTILCIKCNLPISYDQSVEECYICKTIVHEDCCSK